MTRPLPYRADREPMAFADAVFVPPPVRWLDAWNARTRAALGKPPLPDVSDMPADVADFVEEL